MAKAAKKEVPTAKGRPLAAVVDDYYTMREERYALQRKADAMKKNEEALKEAILKELRASRNTTGISGKVASVQLVTKEKVIAEDWGLIHDYILKNDAFDLVQRRLSDEAVKSRWELGESVPGVNKLKIQDLSVSKV